MKQITAEGSTDSCRTTRAAASLGGRSQREEVSWRAEAEVQVVDKQACEAGAVYQAGL